MAKLHAVVSSAVLVLMFLASPADMSAQQNQTTTREVRPFTPVTDAVLRNPDPDDWLMIHRTYDFQGYSPLDQITRENVDQLQLVWIRAMDAGPQEIRPLVYDGVMYVAHAGSDHLQALDATTGDLVWDFTRQAPEDLRQYATVGNRTRRHLHLRQPHPAPDRQTPISSRWMRRLASWPGRAGWPTTVTASRTPRGRRFSRARC